MKCFVFARTQVILQVVSPLVALFIRLLRSNARVLPRKHTDGTNSLQLCRKAKVKPGEALFRRGDCCSRVIKARFMQ